METLIVDMAKRSDEDAAEWLLAFFGTANDAFFNVEVESRRITWSRGVQLLFGHDPERIGTRLQAWQEFVHPDERDALITRGRRIVSAGTSWSDEFRFARADGSFAAVRARAFVIRRADLPTHVVGSLADLSPLRSIEEELRVRTAELTAEVARERHERIRAELLMRSASSETLGEWVIATGEIRWSPNVSSVLGYEASELPTIDSIAKRIHPEDLDGSLGELRRVIEEGGAGWAGRLRFRGPDGRDRQLESHVNLLRDEQGDAVMAIGSVRRIPEEPGPDALVAPILTSRQSEVLRLVRLGHSNKEIAARLSISEQAAKAQVSKLLRKFRVHNRASLVALADRLIKPALEPN
jgi:PAS domain S-box-containing protein